MKMPAADPLADVRANAGPALVWLTLLCVWRVGLGWLAMHGYTTNLLPWLSGFTPIASLAVGGGFLLRKGLAMPVTLGLMALSDVALTAIYGESLMAGDLVARYGCLCGLIMLGRACRVKKGETPGLIAGTLAGAVLFYVVTNTASWLGSPAYPPGFSGWTQALTTGLPGFPPSWVFFRNSLVSDLMVSMLFAAVCQNRPARTESAESVLAPRATVNT